MGRRSVRRVGKWVDRHLWILPFLIFIVTEIALIAIHQLSSRGVLLAAVDLESRKEIYSSLTGSSSGLLGFALAAVAIMTAFGRRQVSDEAARKREDDLAKARTGISKILLATSVLLMLILVIATVAVGVDDGKTGNFALTSVIFSAAISSLSGLLISGAGMTLSLVERSSEP